ncbi:MAG: hypothetical protein ACRDRT_15060, partial [Pseudonocardiaceae bacterium]
MIDRDMHAPPRLRHVLHNVVCVRATDPACVVGQGKQVHRQQYLDPSLRGEVSGGQVIGEQDSALELQAPTQLALFAWLGMSPAAPADNAEPDADSPALHSLRTQLIEL